MTQIMSYEVHIQTLEKFEDAATMNNRIWMVPTMILQNLVQSLVIIDNHFRVVSSTFVALFMAIFTCQT